MSYREIEHAIRCIQSESGVEIVVTREDFPRDEDGPAFTVIAWHVGYTADRERVPGEDPPACGRFVVGDSDTDTDTPSHPPITIASAIRLSVMNACQAAWSIFGVLIDYDDPEYPILRDKGAPSMTTSVRRVVDKVKAFDGSTPFQGIVMAKVEVHAENENTARTRMKQYLEGADCEVIQVASVQNLNRPTVSDGTNGPRETISDKLSGPAIPSVFGVGED